MSGTLIVGGKLFFPCFNTPYFILLIAVFLSSLIPFKNFPIKLCNLCFITRQYLSSTAILECIILGYVSGLAEWHCWYYTCFVDYFYLDVYLTDDHTLDNFRSQAPKDFSFSDRSVFSRMCLNLDSRIRLTSSIFIRINWLCISFQSGCHNLLFLR